MEVVEYVKSLTLGEVFAALVIILGVISAFVEWNKSIPAHPLTAFFSWLGKCFTQSTARTSFTTSYATSATRQEVGQWTALSTTP